MPDPILRDPKENPFPGIPEPHPSIESLQRTVAALTRTVKILTGELGDGRHRAILREEIP